MKKRPLNPLYLYFLAMCVVWNITFVLEEEAFQPDSSQRGNDGGANDLPGFKAFALYINLPLALLQVDQHHLLVHLQGTLDKSTATTHYCSVWVILQQWALVVLFMFSITKKALCFKNC